MKKKRFLDTEVWKWIRTLLELVALAAVIIGIILLFRAVGISEGVAEEQDEYDNVTIGYVICDDYVNVRPFPNKKGEPLGRYEPGTKVYLDGKKKNVRHSLPKSRNRCGSFTKMAISMPPFRCS